MKNFIVGLLLFLPLQIAMGQEKTERLSVNYHSIGRQPVSDCRKMVAEQSSDIAGILLLLIWIIFL